MPRYYFHIQDGQSYPDNVGCELADLRAARLEAVRLSGEVLRDEAEKFWSCDEWQMKVTDDVGLVLFLLNFTACDAPSTKPSDWSRAN